MDDFEERITAELQVLVGEPIVDCWRATNMQIFEFGPRETIVNRRGELVEVSDLRLHIQCRWRFVDRQRILFARDDINYPADENIDIDDFDWDKQESTLDVKQREWFERHRDAPCKVTKAVGDRYGGFRLELESGHALECFPCDSQQGQYSEHWRLLGHRADGSHFVVKGDGVEKYDDGEFEGDDFDDAEFEVNND